MTVYKLDEKMLRRIQNYLKKCAEGVGWLKTMSSGWGGRLVKDLVHFPGRGQKINTLATVKNKTKNPHCSWEGNGLKVL